MPPSSQAEPLLCVEGLTVSFPGDPRDIDVVRGVDLTIGRGELLGLVGESGCGKTMTALAVMRLLPTPGRITAGRVVVAGEDLTALPERQMRRRRGSRVAMIFQEPMSALNPVFTVGFQIAEAVRAHHDVSRAEARTEAVELLRRVAVEDAARRYDAYPHQLSGGQRQRVMIAMALAGTPDLLLADEPTTALDVTVQAGILALLDELRHDLGVGILLITHDLAVVGQSCDRVVVMYAGEVVEEAPAKSLFNFPAHPYAAALLGSLPRLGHPVPRGELPVIPGRVPDPGHLPAGCAFHPRCTEAMVVCQQSHPVLYQPRSLAAGEETAAAGTTSLPTCRRLARCFLHDPSLTATDQTPLREAHR